MAKGKEKEKEAKGLAELLAAININSVVDAEEEEKARLEGLVAELTAQLALVKSDLAAVERRLREKRKPREKAVRLLAEAARTLGLDPQSLGIPVVEAAPRPSLGRGVKGLRLWVQEPGDASLRLIGDETPSRVIQKYSRGCGGSIGGPSDGRCTLRDFTALYLAPKGLKWGDPFDIELPNGNRIVGKLE